MKPTEKPWERRKPMAKVEQFVRSRLRPAMHDSEHTRLSCIYAHYRKWAFFQDQAPYSLKNFEEALGKATRRSFEEFRGEHMYPVWVRSNEAEKKEDPSTQEKKATQSPIVKGQVEVTRELCFREMSIPAGEVLDWLEPTQSEKDRLEMLKAAGATGSSQHVMVMFRGVRRMVPSDAIRRKL